MNEISKLNERKGKIFIKTSNFIKNNNKVILYKAVKTVTISGTPEILKKLNLSISSNNKMSFNFQSIKIELDNNQKSPELGLFYIFTIYLFLIIIYLIMQQLLVILYLLRILKMLHHLLKCVKTYLQVLI